MSHIYEALANLVTSKLRSFLAILGILVGTASVVALITSGQLATEHALAQFKSLGTNLLVVDIQEQQGGGSSGKNQDQQHQFTIEDLPKLYGASSQITLVAPYISLYQSIYFRGEKLDGQVLGATVELADIVKMHIARGRFVSYLDRNSFYCVIGSEVAEKFKKKGITDPIGQQVLLGDWIFTVVGVLQPWKPNWFLYAEINKGLIIPLQTSYLLSKDAKINNLLLRLVPDPKLAEVQRKIAAQLQSLLPNEKITFRTPQQIIDIMQNQHATFTWLLGSIGGISLLVGGIGVMNIMLVSVVERRREIGIRMAIGARQADIRGMFLIESIILTLLGGIIGIIVGLAASFVLAMVTGWEFHLLLLPPALGFIVSVLVGIVSGFYPAFRASKLDPIETLRGE